MTSFLQSKEWMEFQRSLGRGVFEYEKEGISARIIKYDLPFGKSYLYIPHGPEMDFNRMTGGLKNPVANFVKWLRESGKSQKSIFIKAEPLVDSVAQALVEAKFRKSKKEIQPSKTVVIDLGQNEDELLMAMHHKTRYNIGVADKHGIVIGEDGSIDSFLRLLKKTAKRDRFNPHPAEYYKKMFDYNGLQTKLYSAKHDGKSVAAALVLIYGDAGYYLHGASDYEHHSLMAPYALHWHIIKQLKAEGLKKYDLWGIDARKWPGVTRFKLGWLGSPKPTGEGGGSHVVEYPGSFDLPLSKFWHLVYKLARKIL
ncbi:MAG: peptidoglycan bridge formation glycyltransferase FemA/FemB family protein [Candidatus Yanofskybacteria bacterium]|nr:peptidoglycan bridge formation glycyltransferase FemA/FemB family protein [Candidatus Yanofskybacteria bacterium]